MTDEVAAPAPFFIVGSGRSGSTLLRVMLASHSRLAIPPETWYLIPLLERFGVDQRLNADEVELAISIITSHYRWPDMRFDAQDFRQHASGSTKPAGSGGDRLSSAFASRREGSLGRQDAGVYRDLTAAQGCIPTRDLFT